jgi:hypothetical protein
MKNLDAAHCGVDFFGSKKRIAQPISMLDGATLEPVGRLQARRLSAAAAYRGD